MFAGAGRIVGVPLWQPLGATPEWWVCEFWCAVVVGELIWGHVQYNFKGWEIV